MCKCVVKTGKTLHLISLMHFSLRRLRIVFLVHRPRNSASEKIFSVSHLFQVKSGSNIIRVSKCMCACFNTELNMHTYGVVKRGWGYQTLYLVQLALRSLCVILSGNWFYEIAKYCYMKCAFITLFAIRSTK